MVSVLVVWQVHLTLKLNRLHVILQNTFGRPTLLATLFTAALVLPVVVWTVLPMVVTIKLVSTLVLLGLIIRGLTARVAIVRPLLMAVPIVLLLVEVEQSPVLSLLRVWVTLLRTPRVRWSTVRTPLGLLFTFPGTPVPTQALFPGKAPPRENFPNDKPRDREDDIAGAVSPVPIFVWRYLSWWSRW